jgi:hypothetical protein
MVLTYSKSSPNFSLPIVKMCIRIETNELVLLVNEDAGWGFFFSFPKWYSKYVRQNFTVTLCEAISLSILRRLVRRITVFITKTISKVYGTLEFLHFVYTGKIKTIFLANSVQESGSPPSCFRGKWKKYIPHQGGVNRRLIFFPTLRMLVCVRCGCDNQVKSFIFLRVLGWHCTCKVKILSQINLIAKNIT